MASNSSTETAILAGGCFWGMQELVRALPGVLSTRVGYSGGDVPNATYRRHGTHAEALEVVFNPQQLSFRELLEFFFQIHDPSTHNRQGNDMGPSYRSGIYFTSPQQEATAHATIADVDASALWPGKVVTEVKAAGDFWQAEPEHQDYLQHNPYGYTCHYARPKWQLPKKALPAVTQAGAPVHAAPATVAAPAPLLTWEGVLRLASDGNVNPPRRDERSDNEWSKTLSPERFQVTRKHGTERPFSSAMCERFEPGRYACACCGTELFDASTKFDSGTGWPSFTQAVTPGVVAYHGDFSHGMQRIEALCNVCDAHLGHVFPDGPQPSGLRYCINALSLKKV